MSKRQKRIDALVGRCAEVAGKAPKITAYVMVYQTDKGAIRSHRGGDFGAQIGMLRIVEADLVNSVTAGDE